MPTELAEEYHVRVRLKAGPFEVDENAPSVIRANELRGPPSPLKRLTSVFTHRQTGEEDVEKDNHEDE